MACQKHTTFAEMILISYVWHFQNNLDTFSWMKKKLLGENATVFVFECPFIKEFILSADPVLWMF